MHFKKQISILHSSYIFYKPFNVLSQFTAEVEGQRCLSDCIQVPSDVYAVGRLDYDSEGLLFLTNDGSLNKKLLSPNFHIKKTYYVQVEGQITAEVLAQIKKGGIEIKLPNKKIHFTLPCEADFLSAEKIECLPERDPPIRFRAHIPNSWISLTITEGKNRQIRKMCAKVGYPVLRLIRWSFGEWSLENMKPGALKKIHL